MKTMMLLVAAGAMAFAPATVMAAPGGNGSTNGAGWTHTNGPDHPTGQAFAECGEDGPTPGGAADAPGGGSAFADEEISVAGAHYAGEQPQNSRNTASVSQYDTACLHQPQ